MTKDQEWPSMTCTVCGATEVVRPDGRGYPDFMRPPRYQRARNESVCGECWRTLRCVA